MKIRFLDFGKQTCGLCNLPPSDDEYCVFVMGATQMGCVRQKKSLATFDFNPGEAVNGFAYSPVPNVIHEDWFIDTRRRDKKFKNLIKRLKRKK